MPPTLPQSRIKHVVVLMLENRSFDHMFGFFQPAAGQTIENLLGAHASLSNLFDPSKPASASNPAISVSQPAPFAVHDKDGPSHSFVSVNVQLCNDAAGPSAPSPVKNNGYVRSYKDDLLRRTHQTNRSQIAEVMESFAPSQLPAINQLAREFCLCDHWFCEVPGPTLPNRMYIHAATSEGYVHDDFKRDFTSKTIYEQVADKELTWCTYFHDLNEVLQFKNVGIAPDHFRRFADRWASDVSGGTLPNYVFILPRFLNTKATSTTPAKFANSQHPPEDVRFGEQLIADVYDALAANHALFSETVLIVTYDEHGGFFDHVAPGPAPNPDGQNSPNPDDTANFQVPAFAFDRMGLRVPTLVVSPWIQQGTVENRNLQHTSVIATARQMFGLAAPLNKRDAIATSFADLFTRRPTPRTAAEMPAKLARPPAVPGPAVSSLAIGGRPIDPGDEPLDPLTDAWVRGLAAVIARRTGQPLALAGATAAEVMPTTHGEAADFVDRHLRTLGI